MMRLGGALAVGLAVFAGTAGAQGRWQSYDNENRGIAAGAIVCPQDGSDEAANYFCVGLSCGAGKPLGFEVLFAGGELADRLEGVIEVDGQEAGRLDLTRIRPPDYESEYRAAYDPAAHGALIEALRTGRSAAISLVSPELTVRKEFGMRWSGRIIDAALAVCAAPEVPVETQGAGLPGPAEEVLAEVRAACNGGTVTPRDGFVTETDLDMDGVADLVIDYGAAECSTSLVLFCGSAGCQNALYRGLPGGGYDLLGKYYFYGIESRQVTLTEMPVHGTNCGGIGADPCTLRFIWEDGKMVPLQ